MDLASERYRLLISQLRQERRLSQAAVAALLGVHQTYISKIESGARVVGRNALEQAIQRMDLDPDYFFDESLGEPRYRDFIAGARPAKAPGDEPRVVLDREDGASGYIEGFILARDLTAEEEKAIRSVQARGGLPQGLDAVMRFLDETLEMYRAAKAGKTTRMRPKPVKPGER